MQQPITVNEEPTLEEAMRRVKQWYVNGMCMEEGEGARQRRRSEQRRVSAELLPLGFLDEWAGERK